MWLAYSFRFDNLCFETVFVMVNFVFYTMEMKFVMCKDLKMVIGEVGPVEVELLLSCIIFFVAYYGGVDAYQNTIGEQFSVDPEGYLGFLAPYEVKYLTGGIFLPLLAMFLGENLGDCITSSTQKTLYYLAPVLVMFGLAYTSSYTSAY